MYLPPCCSLSRGTSERCCECGSRLLCTSTTVTRVSRGDPVTEHLLAPLCRYATKALWNLAFNERCRKAITAKPGLVDAVRGLLRTSESRHAREAAKGVLWTLGLPEDIDALHEGGKFAGDGDGETAEHVMLSYEWGSQQKVRQMGGDDSALLTKWVSSGSGGAIMECLRKPPHGDSACPPPFPCR